MLQRVRAAFRRGHNGPWILASAIVFAVVASPFAIAAGEGTAIFGGQRNPGTDSGAEYGKTTAIIADTSGYGTRQSNKSSNGGGAIYGCRSASGGSSSGNEPCIRANNLSNGRAFEFVSSGTEVGRIEAASASSAPFTTNAGGVATGLNADKVDGQSSSEIVAAAQALNKIAAIAADGALLYGRGVTSSSRTAQGVYSVVLPDDVSKCAYQVTESATASSGASAAEAVDAKTLRVVTRDNNENLADRSFHLAVIC